MIANLCDGFIFAFNVSQEPFAKIKTTKFCCPWRVNHVSIRPTLAILTPTEACQGVYVPLMATAQTIQEIKVLHKHSCTKQRVAQG